MRTRLIMLLLVLFLPIQANAKPLVADLSQYEIAIDSSFTGAKLILFGARQAAGDVIVVVRGPAREFTLRKKDRVAGVWINRSSMQMHDIPDYYAIASTKPIESILSPELLKTLRIGVANLPYNTAPASDEDLTAEEKSEFEQAFIVNRLRRNLYTDNQGSVTFMGDTLFKTTLPFPDITPRGGYTAETYLVYNGQIVGIQSTPLLVAKRGFDAAIFQLAHEYPAIYGIIAVIMAISAGWMASMLFRKL